MNPGAAHLPTSASPRRVDDSFRHRCLTSRSPHSALLTRPTPSIQALAARLIACDAKGAKFSRKAKAPTFTVIAKLRPHLATLMGNGGYRALLMRALALASAEVAWLRAVRVAADGSLDGPGEPAPPLRPEEILEGRVALVAQLLALLVAFIGESLMLRLIHEIWPQLPTGNLNASKDDNHET